MTCAKRDYLQPCLQMITETSLLLVCDLSIILQVITSGCATFEPWASALGGIVGGLIVLPSSLFVLHVLKVDDPVDAVTVSPLPLLLASSAPVPAPASFCSSSSLSIPVSYFPCSFSTHCSSPTFAWWFQDGSW